MTAAHQHLVRPQRRNCQTAPLQHLAGVISAQASERSEERRSQHAAFCAYLDKLPFELETAQLKVCHAVLARDPLALDRAMRLAVCPPLGGPRDFSFTRFPCKLHRLCTYCPERRARREATKLTETAQHFLAPVAVLLTWPTHKQPVPSIAGTRIVLRQEMTLMRAALRRLTRSAWFSKVVRAGALAFECPLGKGTAHWHLHAHGIVDAPGITPAQQARCNAEWQALAGPRLARFSFEPLKDTAALVGYALKLGDRPSSWAPALGALTDEQRAELDAALDGRRMTTVWKAPSCPA